MRGSSIHREILSSCVYLFASLEPQMDAGAERNTWATLDVDVAARRAKKELGGDFDEKQVQPGRMREKR